MLSHTKGIVLHFVKYGEHSIIATVYTEKFGRQSYIINSARGKKALNKASMLQPLYLLDMVVYEKQSREVQRLKESKASVVYHSLPFDIRKSTQAIFIAEILHKLLREEESNPELFNFIENAACFLDMADKGVSNFHLFFLAKLTRFLGIFPHFKSGENDSFLDLKKGTTSKTEPPHTKFMDIEETRIFYKLVGINLKDLPELSINRQVRIKLLGKILEYYSLHFDSMGEIKSLPVLKEVFNQ